MTDTEAVFEHLKHQIDRARDSGRACKLTPGKRVFATRPCIWG
jgi:hypothetical protein